MADAMAQGSGTDRGFKQAGIPTALADEILEVLRANPWLGRRPSLSLFATQACQEELRRLYEQIHQRQLVLQDRREPSGEDDLGPDTD